MINAYLPSTSISALLCNNVSEAEQKFKEATPGSVEAAILYARWIELANDEAEREAPLCTSPSLAAQKSKGAPKGSAAAEIWEDRSTELSYH